MERSLARIPFHAAMVFYEREIENYTDDELIEKESIVKQVMIEEAARYARSGEFLERNYETVSKVINMGCVGLTLVPNLPAKSLGFALSVFYPQIEETCLRPLYQAGVRGCSDAAHDQLSITLREFSEKDPQNFQAFVANESRLSSQEKMDYLCRRDPSFGKEISHKEPGCQEALNRMRRGLFEQHKVSELVRRGQAIQEKSKATHGEKFNQFYDFMVKVTHKHQSIVRDIQHRTDFVQQVVSACKAKVNSSTGGGQSLEELHQKRKEIESIRDELYKTSKPFEDVPLQNRASVQGVLGAFDGVNQLSREALKLCDRYGIHLPPPLRKGIAISQTAFKVASLLPQIALAPLSPQGVVGILQGLGAAIGIFRRGSNGIDPQSLYHREVMQEFNKLHLQGTRILQEVQVVQEMCKQLAKNQEVIWQEIKALDQKMDQYHGLIKTQLASIHHNTVMIRIGVSTMLDTGLTSLRRAKAKLDEESYYIPEQRRFIDHAHLDQFYQKHIGLLSKGLEALQLQTMQPGLNEGYFVLGEQYSNEHIFHAHFRALIGYYMEQKQRIEVSHPMTLSALLAPSREVSALDEKISRMKNYDSSLILPKALEGIHPQSLFQAPYVFSKVKEYALSALQFHPFYQFIDGRPGYPLVAPGDILKVGPKMEGLEILQNVSARICVALIQYNLLSGDILLPLLYEDYQTKRKEIEQLISYDPTLAANFMIYAFRKRLQQNQRTTLDYHSGFYSQKNNWLLQELLGKDWNFQWSEKKNKWEIKVGEILHDLPSPPRVIKGELFVEPITEELIELFVQVEKEMYYFYPSEDEGDNHHKETREKEYEQMLFLLKASDKLSQLRNNQPAGESHDIISRL